MYKIKTPLKSIRGVLYKVRPYYATVIVVPIKAPSIKNAPLADFQEIDWLRPFISPSNVPSEASPADALPDDSNPK